MEMIYSTAPKLNVSAFMAYLKDIEALILETGAENLRLTKVFPPFQNDLRQMEKVYNRTRGNALTLSVKNLDKARDCFTRVLLTSLHSMSQLPINNKYYKPALTAYSVLKQYKGIERREYTEEKGMLDGLLSNATKPEVLAALEELHLKGILDMLTEAAEAWHQAFMARVHEKGKMLDEMAGLNSQIVRRRLVEDLKKIVSMVNAVYITSTDPEELARLETFIAHANGIVTQYRAVQRNRKREKEE